MLWPWHLLCHRNSTNCTLCPLANTPHQAPFPCADCVSGTVLAFVGKCIYVGVFNLLKWHLLAVHRQFNGVLHVPKLAVRERCATYAR